MQLQAWATAADPTPPHRTAHEGKAWRAPMVLKPSRPHGTYDGSIHDPAEKGPMRARRTIRAFSLAATVAILSTSGTFAQIDGPAATPRPQERPGATMAVLRNELADPALDRIVDTSARFAFSQIGGRPNRDLQSALLPDSNALVLRARDLADEAQTNDKPIAVMVLAGGDSDSTSSFARAFPNTTFIDIDQSRPCLTVEGDFDPTGQCPGGIEAVPFNQAIVGFDADQPAYLAGILAASASRNDRLGIISATPQCAACNRIIQGYVRGARSVKPEIAVDIAYLATEENFAAEGGPAAAFGDQAAARTLARAFIDVYQPDVILPVAGAASRGVIEAVCQSEGRLAVGTEIDVAAAYPELADCVLASIVKDYEYAVRESIFAYANESLRPEVRYGIDDDRAAVTDEWTRRPGLPVDLEGLYQRAYDGILTGQIPTCDAACEAPFDPAAPMGPAVAARPVGLGDPVDPEAAEDQPEPEPAASPA
jgi:basic membrane lipoprotein Med (substrate-binding protein (PBP1-ABC) superfamily)